MRNEHVLRDMRVSVLEICRRGVGKAVKRLSLIHSSNNNCAWSPLAHVCVLFTSFVLSRGSMREGRRKSYTQRTAKSGPHPS